MSASGEPEAPPSVAETVVVCPKCQARNDPTLARCSVCRADLLPGRSGGERLGTLAVGIVVAALVMVLAAFMAGKHAEVPLCASPTALAFFSLALFFGALRFALGRTPTHEKYLNRAQRHLVSVPEQALADLTQALELAPDKIKTRILKQRGDLLSRLGRTEEALQDLTAHAAAPEQGGGAKLLSRVSEIEMKPSVDAATPAEIHRLQQQLVEAGTRQWIGYCKACRTAVPVDVDQRCARCAAELKDVRLVWPEEREQALVNLNREEIGRRRKRSFGTALAVLGLLACVVLPLAGALFYSQQARVPATPTLPAPTTLSPTALFHENVFSFSYPANWWVMEAEDVSILLKTSLKGMTSGEYSYIGGVFAEGLDNCKSCAQIVLMVVTDPGLTGTLTDEQYEAIRAAREQAMGPRLLSHRRVEVASMPAVEAIHLGLSGDGEVLEYIIVPPQPGVAYQLKCSCHKDSFAAFEPVFRQAINTLRIGQAMPTSLPTPTPRSIRPGIPAPTKGPVPRTYTVQPGDTLSQIAKDLGVTMEALAAANGIEDADLIQPGQVLTVPVATP